MYLRNGGYEGNDKMTRRYKMPGESNAGYSGGGEANAQEKIPGESNGG